MFECVVCNNAVKDGISSTIFDYLVRTVSSKTMPLSFEGREADSKNLFHLLKEQILPPF